MVNNSVAKLNQNAYRTFIEKTEKKCKQKTNKPSVVTVLIGHNASTFDTPLLLCSTPSTFSARLKSLELSLQTAWFL
jgi:hypothetical protein